MPLSETTTYSPDIYQLELTDPLQGGPGGVDNLPHIQLANRTAWLKQQVDALAETIALLSGGTASLDSPTLTGTPTAPTRAQDAPSAAIATAGFVRNALGNLASHAAITTATPLNATHVGKCLRASGSPFSITLPEADSVRAGSVIWVINFTSRLVINSQGTDTIDDGTSATSIILAAGDSAMLVSNGGTAWTLLGGSLQLRRAGICAGTLVGNGYVRTPAGHIDQWAYAATGSGGAGSILVPLPTPFGSAVLNAVACSANGGGNPTAVGIGPGSTLNAIDVRFAAGTTGVFIRSIGF